MFKEMMRDNVTLIKQNGKIFENIRADVQTKMIFIDDETLPIEEGDTLTRKLPSGLTESYIVIDRGYYEAFAGLKAHYQIKVEKTTTRQLQNNRGNTSIYNISGNNEKVNINSTDNSINMNINQNEDIIFDDILKVLIDNSINDKEIIEALADMKENISTPRFIDKYNTFIQSAANHMTIIAPFIPSLSKLLSR